VRLYDLQCAIAELREEDTHYVKRLDPPSWGRFLQIMEDVVDDSPSQTWIVFVYIQLLPRMSPHVLL
jgi:hypothetical protein